MKIFKIISFCIILFIAQNFLSGSNELYKVSSKDEILKADKIWKANYDNYIPEESMLISLNEKIDNKLVVDVYLGLWCGDSENNVPKFIKILDSIKKKFKVNYYLCPRKKDGKSEFFVKDKKIKRLPTFVFYMEGKELGRIVENPKESLLEDFLEIVF